MVCTASQNIPGAKPDRVCLERPLREKREYLSPAFFVGPHLVAYLYVEDRLRAFARSDRCPRGHARVATSVGVRVVRAVDAVRVWVEVFEIVQPEALDGLRVASVLDELSEDGVLLCDHRQGHLLGVLDGHDGRQPGLWVFDLLLDAELLEGAQHLIGAVDVEADGAEAGQGDLR